MMMGAGASRIFRRRAMANDFEAGTKKEGSGIGAPWETIGHSLCACPATSMSLSSSGFESALVSSSRHT